MINQRISGRYEIIKKIGSGGMANVYLAKDLILEREVAIKRLAFDFSDDEESLRRFRREALSTTELTHPNIVSIYDVGDEEYPYIVMEYVDGTDLNEFIKENRPIPHDVTLHIMDQILSGMDYAHAQGIIHRDLKPHNILIDHDGHVKITDFGIAVALSENSITQTNSLLGSVHYLSPEQARGHIATKQSDIYALGILLYEMLIGKVPFDGESAVSIALKHFQNEIPSLREQDADIPQPLENVVLKATTKDPLQRYESVQAMREDLKTALDPKRAAEPRFEPHDFSDDATRVLSPLSKTQVVEATQNSEKTKDKPKKKQDKPRGFFKKHWLAITMGCLVLFGVIALALAFSNSRSGEIAVPNLTGMTYEEAVEELERLKLKVGEKVKEPSADVEDGKVIKSTPKAGSTVKKNQKIKLYISEDPVMKNYIGEEFRKAKAELTNLKIKVKKKEVYSNEEPGKILEQDVKANEKIRPGQTTVTFTISQGRQVFSLEDLSKHTKKYVEEYANDLGLELTIKEEPSENVEEGEVISQEPGAGTEITGGERLTVVISTGSDKKGDAEFSATVDIPFAQPEDEEEKSNHIEVFIEDKTHSFDELAYEFDIKEETRHKINFKVEKGKSAKYKIVRDGKPIEESTVSE